MTDFLKEFYYEEEGMEVIEIVIIIAVLVAIALVFRKALTDFAHDLMKNAFNKDATEPPTMEAPY